MSYIRKKERAPRQESPLKKKSTKIHPTGIRLVKQELEFVRKGMSRYAARAVAVAHDIESFRTSHSAAKITRIETHFLETLGLLEAKVVLRSN